MSSQRGNQNRTRAQKYKNRHVFRNDLHDKTPQQKRMNSLHVASVCQHCKGVIEWKIKYKKYKALTQPRTCTRCDKRNVLKAYHVLCRGCALETRCCAKCLKSAEEVEIEPPRPTPVEEQKLKVEMDRLIKSFPERKRRAFLRYMEKGKKQKGIEEQPVEESQDDNVAECEDVVNPKQRVPHTRDELLQKIEQLKLAGNDDFGDDYDSDELDCDDYDGENDEDDEEPKVPEK